MMSRKTQVLASFLVASFALVACQEQTTAPIVASPSADAARVNTSALEQSLVQTLWSNRTALTAPSTVVAVDQAFAESGRQAINPRDYVCSSSSPINDYLNAELRTTLSIPSEYTLFFDMYNRYADLIPTYEALYFQTSATPQTFGYTGAFTQVMTKVERDVKAFWDIPAQDIQVVAMHGTMLADAARTYQTYRLLGLKDKTAAEYAVAVR